MKTSEMIAMLEKNPKLRFESEFEPFKPLTASAGTEALVLRDKEGFRAKLEGLNLKRDWQLIQEPVPWQEALQAWAEGKTVRCDFPKNPASYIFNEFHARSREIDTLNTPLSRDMITSGVWFIDGGEADD